MSGIDDVVVDRMSRELKKVEHLQNRVAICERLWSRSTADVLMAAFSRKTRKQWEEKGMTKFREALKLDVQLTMANMLKVIDTFPDIEFEELKHFNTEYIKIFADWSKKAI